MVCHGQHNRHWPNICSLRDIAAKLHIVFVSNRSKISQCCCGWCRVYIAQPYKLHEHPLVRKSNGTIYQSAIDNMEFKNVSAIIFCSILVWSGVVCAGCQTRATCIRRSLSSTNLMVDNGRCNAAVYTNIHHTYSLVRRFRTKIIVEENKKKK